jgi:hypothetical protein
MPGRCDLIDVRSGVIAHAAIRTRGTWDHRTSYGAEARRVGVRPGLFQAAVAVSGYGDWLHMIAEQEMRHLKLVEYEFGPLPKEEEKYRRSSPFFYIQDIQNPIMLLHGVGAQLPRSAASQLFADRLEMNYKPFV